uniref:TATA-box binding protein n=1 Tax=viral metagenome TaxID=1070528 RepID=A0A6C0C9U2_9ZZZZ
MSSGSKTNKKKKQAIIRHKSANSRNSGSKSAKKKPIEESSIDINKVFDIMKNNSERETRDTKLKTEVILPTNQTSEPTYNINENSQEVFNSYKEARHFLEENGISISTITLDCKLHTLINVNIFSKNVELKDNEIASVKYGNRNDTATNRTIINLDTKKKKSSGKMFFNQVTILMKPTNNAERNYINIKVFKNGSLQMTGCKDMNDFNNVVHTLIKLLIKGTTITRNRITRHLNYITNPDTIGLYDTKIRMINSNFQFQYKIYRERLSQLLVEHHNKYTKDTDIGYVEHKYSSNSSHSCVNIKFKYDENKSPSIFVFQTGSIIITGAKNLQHIIASYDFIQKIIAKYKQQIMIVDLDQDAVRAEIANYFLEKRKSLI